MPLPFFLLSSEKPKGSYYAEPLTIGTNKSNNVPEKQPKLETAPKEDGDTSGEIPDKKENLKELIKRIKPSIIFIESERANDKGEGSGFIISHDGYILTCHHVIENARKIKVRYKGMDNRFKVSLARVMWSQEDIDVSLIKLQQNPDVVPIDIGNVEGVEEGHQIIAIGFPLGSSLGVEPTVTTGIISSMRQLGIRRQVSRRLFQISAPVNPGNSGGALVSIETGKAIGIVNAKIKQAEGIGFAIPIENNIKLIIAKESGVNF